MKIGKGTLKTAEEETLINRLEQMLKRVYSINDILGSETDKVAENASANTITQVFDLICDIDNELNTIEKEIKRLKWGTTESRNYFSVTLPSEATSLKNNLRKKSE